MDKGKLSDIIVTNVITKSPSIIRPNLIYNIKTIKEYLIQNYNIDTTEIDKLAFTATIEIKPMLFKLVGEEISQANVVTIIKSINDLSLQLDTMFPLKQEDVTAKLFIKTYFLYMVFIISCRIITKQVISLNIPTVAVFMGPLFDELALFTYVLTKQKLLKINGYFKSSKFTRLFFDSLYSGGFTRPFSIESLAINIMYDVYLKLFENEKIKRILKLDIDKDINKLTFLFFTLLVSIYCINIKPYLNRSSRYLITLYEKNKG